MTAETTQTIAGILAQRLGVERNLIEGTLADKPLAAAMALSLLQRPPPETCDPAQTVRFVATLVGACPVCLGEDRICHECGGRGGPGSRDPDAGRAGRMDHAAAAPARSLRRQASAAGAGHNHEGA